LRRQAQDCFAHRLNRLSPGQIFEWTQISSRMQERSVIVRIVTQRRQQMLDPQTAEHVVPSYTQQKRADRTSRGVKDVTFAHEEEKDLLRDVLGDCFRPAHLQG